MMPPTLATRLQVPTAWFLITVGNISAVYTYTIANEAEAPNLPNRDRRS